MEKQEVYEFIGNMADGLYKNKIRIRFGRLRQILRDKGKEVGPRKGMASTVRGAYNYWMEKDEAIAEAVAFSYTNQQDQLAFDV